MLKIEWLWRELLYQAIEKKNPYFRLSYLSDKFNLSTSVVSYALFPLRQLGIVEIGKTNSYIKDSERLLFFWATRRNFKKDIIYQTFTPLPVFEIEASMPPAVFPTAYSGYHLYFNEIPADYEKVYFYSQDIREIKKRFPPNEKKSSNLFILKGDQWFFFYKKTPWGQIFVDLWNLTDWYAKEFQEALLLKIRQKIGL